MNRVLKPCPFCGGNARVVEEMFGDREVYTINDNDKERIKAFVKQIYDEWELAEVEEGSET